MPRHTAILAVLLAIAAPAVGETVRLRDGTALTGTIHSTGGGYSVTPIGGVAHFVAAADVRSFELTGNPATRPALDKTAAADRANELAAHARELLRRGDTVGADAAARSALDADRRNATALYLRGVIAFDNGDTPAARQRLEAADRASPHDGPTLNNLAVVLWRQNQPVAAMIRYDAAMRAVPGDRRTLDNVAAAVQSLPVEAARAPAVIRAVRRFHDQDADLAKRLPGMRRVNGVWTSDDQVDKLDDRQRRVVTALDQIAAGTAADAERLADLDGTLSGLNRGRAGIGADGVPVVAPPSTTPPPSRVAAEAARVEKMQADRARADGVRAERSAIVFRMTQATADAEQLRRQLPADLVDPKQRMVGVEGTPFVPVQP